MGPLPEEHKRSPAEAVCVSEAGRVDAAETKAVNPPQTKADVERADARAPDLEALMYEIEDMTWGWKSILAPRFVILVGVLYVAFATAAWMFLVRFETTLDRKFLALAAVCFVGEKFLMAVPVFWQAMVSHGGFPKAAPVVAAAVFSLINGAEALGRQTEPKVVFLVGINVVLPLILRFRKGKRQCFASTFLLVRGACQFFIFFGTQGCIILQQKLQDNPVIAGNLFIILGSIYKAASVPAMRWVWSLDMRGDCPYVVYTVNMAAIRYTTESTFFAGLIFPFVNLPEDKAVRVAATSIASKVVFRLLSRLGLVDSFWRAVTNGKWGKVDFEKELLFRVSALQVPAQVYGLSLCAAMAMAPSLLGMDINSWLRLPSQWVILFAGLLSGLLSEFLTACFMLALRRRRRPDAPKMGVLDMLGSLTDAGVNEFVGIVDTPETPSRRCNIQPEPVQGCFCYTAQQMAPWLPVQTVMIGFVGAIGGAILNDLSSRP